MKSKSLIFLLAITFILKIPSLFEPPWYGDEGIYMTIGQNINRNLILYKDIIDNKPPLIYYLASVFSSQLSFRLLFCFIGIISVYLFARISKSFQATVIFILLTQTPLLEGNIPNGENLMLLPILLATYLLYREKIASSQKIFIIGFISGFALLAKLTSVFDIIAIFLLIVLRFPKPKFSGFYFLAGSVIPFTWISLLFFLNHTFSYFKSAVVTNNFGYIGSWYTGNHTSLYLSPGIIIKGLSAIFILIISLYFLKKHPKKVIPFYPAIWFVLAYLGSSLSGRPYTHYLIQLAAPLSLLFSQLLQKFSKTFQTILFFGFFVYVFLKTKGYYQNFLYGNYSDNYDSRVSSIQMISSRIKQNTQPSSYLFTWNDEPYFYYLSQRTPAFPYILRYHVDDRQQRLPLVKAIQNHSAAVVISAAYPPFIELQNLLNHYYRLDYAYGPYSLFLPR